MLWIVGVWHLQEYLAVKNSWNNLYTTCITVGVFSMFTFISGYFMSRRTKKLGDCLQFYKKRLIRFYPRFFVSCMLLLYVWREITQRVLDLILLIIGSHPMTLIVPESFCIKIYNDYDFELNYHVLDKENFYDLTSKYPEIKSNIEDRFGYCFSVPSPISSPCIELTYAEGEPIIGSYESVIFNPIESWNMDGGAYHNVYTISNSLINTLKKALV